MMACKKALVEAKGDDEKAVDILLKKGETKAAEKKDRVAKEGVVAIAMGKGKAAVVKVNCETDFVARNEGFIDFAKKVSEGALSRVLRLLRPRAQRP